MYITEACTIRPCASGALPSSPQAPLRCSVIACPYAKSAPLRCRPSNKVWMWSKVNASSWSSGAISSPRASATSWFTAAVPATFQNAVARDGYCGRSGSSR